MGRVSTWRQFAPRPSSNNVCEQISMYSHYPSHDRSVGSGRGCGACRSRPSCSCPRMRAANPPLLHALRPRLVRSGERDFSRPVDRDSSQDNDRATTLKPAAWLQRRGRRRPAGSSQYSGGPRDGPPMTPPLRPGVRGAQTLRRGLPPRQRRPRSAQVATACSRAELADRRQPCADGQRQSRRVCSRRAPKVLASNLGQVDQGPTRFGESPPDLRQAGIVKV